jgi:hypothetical protein
MPPITPRGVERLPSATDPADRKLLNCRLRARSRGASWQRANSMQRWLTIPQLPTPLAMGGDLRIHGVKGTPFSAAAPRSRLSGNRATLFAVAIPRSGFVLGRKPAIAQRRKLDSSLRAPSPSAARSVNYLILDSNQEARTPQRKVCYFSVCYFRSHIVFMQLFLECRFIW